MRCDHHPTCPGCPLLSLDEGAQLENTGGRVLAALDAYPHLNLGVAPPLQPAARSEGYRHRLKLPVHMGQNRISMGLIDSISGRTLHTPDCPVLIPALREAIEPMLAALHGQRSLHSVDLRVSAETGALQLVLATHGGQLSGADALTATLLAEVPGLASVAVSTADPRKVRIMGHNPRVIAGESRIIDKIGDTELHIFPGAFFQTDPLTAAGLHAMVREAVGEAETVLDLYAGVGAYARMLAPGRQRVVAIEESVEAAEAAREGAPENMEVICDRAEGQDLRALGPFDAAVINPARRGSRPEVLTALARSAQRLVYVSCGPESLARDLDVLAYFGMRVQRIQTLDLFPQTAEIETVVTLVRGKPQQQWALPSGGEARGPWGEHPSGAVGRPARVLVLVIGDTGEHGKLRESRYRRLGQVAGHSLLRVDLNGPLVPALAGLARRGHPTAGRHHTTDRFFADRAGLQRPFLHIERTAEATAPLHGDLVTALRSLGASERLIARAGAPRP
jgi:23S rRNA (uracil1939-C5)-methyltransferase